MAETHYLLKSLCISEAFTGVLEKFQCGSDMPNTNYNNVVFFLGQIYVMLRNR